jgi:hypothetical protein
LTIQKEKRKTRSKKKRNHRSEGEKCGRRKMKEKIENHKGRKPHAGEMKKQKVGEM